jgi:hypothetical protein
MTRPREIRTLIRIVDTAGSTVVTCAPMEEREGYWMFTIRDPKHNHFANQHFYERYAAQAGVKLCEFMNTPGGEHGALVGLVVSTPQPRRE